MRRPNLATIQHILATGTKNAILRLMGAGLHLISDARRYEPYRAKAGKYQPHQGKRERARRVARMQRAA